MAEHRTVLASESDSLAALVRQVRLERLRGAVRKSSEARALAFHNLGSLSVREGVGKPTASASSPTLRFLARKL